MDARILPAFTYWIPEMSWHTDSLQPTAHSMTTVAWDISLPFHGSSNHAVLDLR